VGSPPILLNNLSKHPGHRGPQLLQINVLAHPQGPHLSDLLIPLHHVLGSGVPQLHLHPTPNILNGVEVSGISSLFQLLLQEIQGGSRQLGGMTRPPHFFCCAMGLTGLALAKEKNLNRVTLYIPTGFMMFLWGTLAL